MRWFLVMLLMSALGWVGWFAGSPLGLGGSFVLSMIGSGIGMYLGRKLVNEYLP